MAEDLIFDTLERIGSTPRAQLAWVVGLVEGRAPETPEDWGNLRRELAVFAMHAAGAASSMDARSPRDAANILEAFRDILARAAEGKRIEGPPQPSAIAKDAHTQRYAPAAAVDRDFQRSVLRGLMRRLIECGHLLKRCEAPAKLRPGRRTRGVTKPEPSVCGKLFVARKQTQRYCSGACSSRTVTRRKRNRPKKKPVARKKTRARRRGSDR